MADNTNTAGGTEKAENIYLTSGKTITLLGKLGEGASLALTTQDLPAGTETVAVTQGWIDRENEDAGIDTIFASDTGNTFQPKDFEVHLSASVQTNHRHDGLNFVDWEQDNTLPTVPGYYALTKNVTLADTWTLNGDYYLCFNGYSVTLLPVRTPLNSSKEPFTVTPLSVPPVMVPGVSASSYTARWVPALIWITGAGASVWDRVMLWPSRYSRTPPEGTV